jgi:hypothetical protein
MVLGGVLVVPIGLIAKMLGQGQSSKIEIPDRQAVAARARAIVMAKERELGYEPVDRELDKLGYDIESRIPGTGRLRFIEVKGRIEGAETVTVTRNEVLYSLNKPDDFIFAIVQFASDGAHNLYYLRNPFQSEPGFGATSHNYQLSELLSRAEVIT